MPLSELRMGNLGIENTREATCSCTEPLSSAFSLLFLEAVDNVHQFQSFAPALPMLWYHSRGN